MSGHDVAPADADPRALALCIISPDRPGVGRTDRLPGYTTLPWVRSDLIPLLDHLGVDRFGVMGWSEGGQYALAAAFALSERAVRCAVVAGCLPLDDKAILRGTNLLDRSLTALSQRCPAVARTCFTMMQVLSRHAPGLVLPRPPSDCRRTRPKRLGTRPMVSGPIGRGNSRLARWGRRVRSDECALGIPPRRRDHSCPSVPGVSRRARASSLGTGVGTAYPEGRNHGLP